jgi:hypothetical protein
VGDGRRGRRRRRRRRRGRRRRRRREGGEGEEIIHHQHMVLMVVSWFGQCQGNTFLIKIVESFWNLFYLTYSPINTVGNF